MFFVEAGPLLPTTVFSCRDSGGAVNRDLAGSLAGTYPIPELLGIASWSHCFRIDLVHTEQRIFLGKRVG